MVNREVLQEVANKVYDWFWVQGHEQCKTKQGNCKYRFGNDRCAVGVMIPDELYRIGMEAYTPQHLVDEKVIPDAGHDDGGINIYNKLQIMHDSYPKDEFLSRFKEFCTTYQVTFPGDK